VAGWQLRDDDDNGVVLLSPQGGGLAIKTVADLEIITICIRKYLTP